MVGHISDPFYIMFSLTAHDAIKKSTIYKKELRAWTITVPRILLRVVQRPADLPSEGSSVSLLCNFTSFPQPISSQPAVVITWFDDGNLLVRLRNGSTSVAGFLRPTYRLSSDYRTLTVSPVQQQHHARHFQCNADEQGSSRTIHGSSEPHVLQVGCKVVYVNFCLNRF